MLKYRDRIGMDWEKIQLCEKEMSKTPMFVVDSAI